MSTFQTFSKFISITRLVSPLRETKRWKLAASVGSLPLLLAASAFLAPSKADACACGCGVFEVGDFSLLPSGGSGHGLFYVDWIYQDQNQNWSGSSRAPGEANDDKGIKSNFVNIGGQYMFNRSFGLQVDVPYVFRSFTALGGSSGNEVITRQWSEFGDLRINGLYTGLFRDQSLGFSLGVKLPTGDFKHTEPDIDIDRDTQIGTGSTDVLLGTFYHHRITSDNNWWFFGQAQLDVPVLTQDGYIPGIEADETIGVYYNGFSIGGAKIRPIAQVIAAERSQDHGPNSMQPVGSGYERILLSPGIEVDIHRVIIDANVGFPVYQYVTGNQLVSPAVFKVSLSYRF
jgi:hypothetical protein